eukprot:15328544-Ditylum_brightwellii.AAC.1
MAEDSDFIPCSAWIEFTPIVSKEAEEYQENKDLLKETNTLIGDYRKCLKSQVLKCIGINQKLPHKQLVKDFASSLCFITK